MIGTELQRSIDRFAKSVARAATKAPMNRQVGTVSNAFLAVDSLSVQIEGITVEPFWLNQAQCNHDFISAAMTLGQNVIGRRVMVEFAGRQPFIAYLIGA